MLITKPWIMWYWPPAPVGYRNTWQTSVKGWFCFVIPYKSEILDAWDNCCSYTNIQTVWFYHAVMHPKDALGMTDHVDADQTASVHCLCKPVCLTTWDYYDNMNEYKMSHHMTKLTNWTVCPAKTRISLGICPVWSESSLSAWRKTGPFTSHWAQWRLCSDWAQADLSHS